MDASSDASADVPNKEDNCHNAERSEEPLAEHLHTESHSIVLSEENLEPIGHLDALMQVHASLDSNLDGLVDGDDAEREDNGCQRLSLLPSH